MTSCGQLGRPARWVRQCKDRRRFNGFNGFLTGGEGIASSILADRLRKLEDTDVVEKRRDPLDARRLLHRLSPKGIDLAPVLVEFVVWSARHGRTDAPAAIVRRMRVDRDAFVAEVRQRWRDGG